MDSTLTDYEHYLFHEWFQTDEVKKELIYARPKCGWQENGLRLFFEVRSWDGIADDLPSSDWDEKVNWGRMADMIENDSTFLRLVG